MNDHKPQHFSRLCQPTMILPPLREPPTLQTRDYTNFNFIVHTRALKRTIDVSASLRSFSTIHL